MSDIWFTSDTHFGHENILKFTNYDGLKVRPTFKDVRDMDETLIENWNRYVKPNDKIYHLGDVTFTQEAYNRVMPRLNGKKRLILGNHDKLPMKEYLKHFEKVRESWQPVREVLFTHRPVLINENDKVKVNVHGHVHRTFHYWMTDHHFNVSTEMTNYTPINMEELFDHLVRKYPGISRPQKDL